VDGGDGGGREPICRLYLYLDSVLHAGAGYISTKLWEEDGRARRHARDGCDGAGRAGISGQLAGSLGGWGWGLVVVGGNQKQKQKQKGKSKQGVSVEATGESHCTVS
jgi:hypothetical protein